MSAYLEAPEDDAISLTLSKFKPDDLLNIIQGLKRVLDQSPEQGRQMLTANQDLTYAVLQAELLMGMVDESVVMEAMNVSQVSGGQADVQSRDDTPLPAAKEVTKETEQAKPSSKPDPFEGMDPQQIGVIKQVISIPEEQLAQLPADQQAQVRSLKQQYAA